MRTVLEGLEHRKDNDCFITETVSISIREKSGRNLVLVSERRMRA